MVERGPGETAAGEFPQNSQGSREELLRSAEAVLLAAGGEVPLRLLALCLGIPVDLAGELVRVLAEKAERELRGYRVELEGEKVALFTHPEASAAVSRLLRRKQRLSRAALETLAVVAYRQPVSRQEIAAARGVDPESSLRSLLEAGLIGEERDATGRTRYTTTREFLIRLGIRSLHDLPPLGRPREAAVGEGRAGSVRGQG